MTENSMLLTLDVGNTNTVIGLYRLNSDELVTHWRISTLRAQTVDEYGVLLLNLFSMRKIEAERSLEHHHLVCGAAARVHIAPGVRTILQPQAHVCGTRHQDRYAHPGR